MFEVSAAKREILRRLAQQDWSPTELAEELGKSPETVYNHLNDLEEQGVLTKKQVPAKTRPRNLYSIGAGLIQYVTVLPGQFREGALPVDQTKEVMFRIWAIPQAEFHPYIERYWWAIRSSAAVDLEQQVTAIGVYGSVARGDASEDSDIDILAITTNEDVKDNVEYSFGTLVLELDEKSKLGMTEVYSEKEYRNSLVHGSDFLDSIRGELHPIYDPDRYLIDPENLIEDVAEDEPP